MQRTRGHAGAFEMARREPAGRQAVREPAALPPAHCAQRQTGHRRLLPRGVGEVGVRQTAHLSLQEPRGPTVLARRICAPALDKSAALRYIIRYKCSAKECARVVPLQQAGEDASPVRCGGCCHFQAGAVRGASPLPAAHGVAAVIRAGGLVGLPQSGPIGQLGWYRDLSFSGRPMINSWGGLFYFVQM